MKENSSFKSDENNSHSIQVEEEQIQQQQQQQQQKQQNTNWTSSDKEEVVVPVDGAGGKMNGIASGITMVLPHSSKNESIDSCSSNIEVRTIADCKGSLLYSAEKNNLPVTTEEEDLCEGQQQQQQKQIPTAFESGRDYSGAVKSASVRTSSEEQTPPPPPVSSLLVDTGKLHHSSNKALIVSSASSSLSTSDVASRSHSVSRGAGFDGKKSSLRRKATSDLDQGEYSMYPFTLCFYFLLLVLFWKGNFGSSSSTW